MVMYSCPRCGYKNTIKTKMKAHFMRKNVCSPISSDKSIEECFVEVFGVKKSTDSKLTHFSDKLTPIDSQMTHFSDKVTPIDSQMTHFSDKVTPIDSQMTLSGSSKIDIPNMDYKHECPYCSRVFSKNSNMHRHMKVCKEKNSLYTEKQVAERVAIRLAEINADRENLMDEKDKIIDELKTQIEKLLTKVGNTTYNYTQNNIVIQPFGKENTKYIPDTYVKDLIKTGPYSSIPKLLKQIHFHPEHKENHNVKIPNKKQALARIYNGQEWEYQDKNLTIEHMSDKAFDIISDHYTEGSSKYMDKFKELYEDHDKMVHKRIQKASEIIILNNQDKE